jgi:superfamily II DNA/RNA helicase
VLIYARTRRSVEAWARRLSEAGIAAIAYHAGMDPESRSLALAHFQEHPAPVLVATVAFGMGVDRPDVGLVLHLDLPASAEGYLQESGRAGRDGMPADCLVLFDPEDRTSLGWAIRLGGQQAGEAAAADPLRLELAQQQLRRMEGVAEGPGCREQADTWRSMIWRSGMSSSRTSGNATHSPPASAAACLGASWWRTFLTSRSTWRTSPRTCTTSAARGRTRSRARWRARAASRTRSVAPMQRASATTQSPASSRRR